MSNGPDPGREAGSTTPPGRFRFDPASTNGQRLGTGQNHDFGSVCRNAIKAVTTVVTGSTIDDRT